MTEPTVQIVPMRYGYQVEVTVKCKHCGKPYRELVGKGAMVSDVVKAETKEVVKPTVKKKKVEQVTSKKPTIASREEVGEPMSFGEKMKIAKAKKKAEMKKAE